MSEFNKRNDTEKIVLVIPISRTHYIVPHIGLGYLAASLRESNFSDIVILDCLKERLSYEDLRVRFNSWRPKVVGFQLFSSDFSSVVKSIDIVKEVSPTTIVLIG